MVFSSPCRRSGSMTSRAEKENSHGALSHPVRSLSQTFAKPRTPLKHHDDRGRSPLPSSARKSLRSPSCGMLATTTNLPPAPARGRSVSISSALPSPPPHPRAGAPRSPATPRASPLPPRAAPEPALTPRRRASAPATPDRGAALLHVPTTPRRLSCPDTPTTAALAAATHTPSPCRSTAGRTPSMRDRPNRVRAMLRIRPVTGADRGSLAVALVPEGDAVRVLARPAQDGGTERVFPFDRVLADSSQQEVYDAVGAPLLSDALQGNSVCLFAYGQTGTGKTHSLQGTAQDEGVVPRLIRDLFARQHDCQVALSLFEVYNERLRDLLEDGPPLELYEDAERRVQVRHLSRHPIPSAADALQLIAQGTARRQVGHTMMNHQSSRSHLVLQLSLAAHDAESLVVVVDLAGSDRASKTEATGETFRESKTINHSLLMLGRSLNSMAEGHAFVPSRDCKITRLLTSHLQGDCRVTVLATVSPVACNATESVCTMEFARNAAAIKQVLRVPATPAAKAAQALKELRQAKEAAEQRCGELELRYGALQRAHVEVTERCEGLARRNRELEARPRPRLSMDMVTDEVDPLPQESIAPIDPLAPAEGEGEAPAERPPPPPSPAEAAAAAQRAAALEALVCQLTDQLQEQSQQLDRLRQDYEVAAQALQRCGELTQPLAAGDAPRCRAAPRLSMDMLMDEAEPSAEVEAHDPPAPSAAAAEAVAQVGRLMEELQERTQQLETLRWDYERLSEERAEAHAGRATADHRVAQLEAGQREAEATHRAEMEVLKQRCDALHAEGEALRRDRGRLAAEATAEAAAQVSHLTKELQERTQQLETVRCEYKRLSEERAEANARRAMADNHVAQLEAGQREAEVSRLTEELQDRTQQLQTLHSEYKRLSEERAEANARHATADHRVAQLEAGQREAEARYQGELQVLLERCGALRAEGEALRHDRDRLAAEVAKQPAQSAAVAEAAAQVGRLTEELQERTQQLETLRWEYERLSEERAEAHVRRATADHRVTQLEACQRAAEARHEAELQALQQRCHALQAEVDSLRHARDRLEAELAAAVTATAAAAAAAPAVDPDDAWLASDTQLAGPGPVGLALGPLSSPWRPASSLATTPRLPAASPLPDQPTPALCSPSRGSPPFESITISDTDSDGGSEAVAVAVVRTCPARRRRSSSGRPRGAGPRSAARPPKARRAAEAPAELLAVGTTVTVLFESCPPLRSGRRASRAGRSPPVLRCPGTVVADHGAGAFLVRLLGTAALADQQERADCKAAALPGPTTAPPAAPVSARQCKDCSRRLTGYHLFTKSNWTAIRQRHSTLNDVHRELGQQWRRLSMKEQGKYKRRAEEENRQQASPLCRGAFNRFVAEERQRMAAKNPRLSFALLQRHAAGKWKTMPHAERAKYSQHTRAGPAN